MVDFFNKVISFLSVFSEFIWENITKLSLWAFGFYLLPTLELIGVTVFFIVAEMFTSIYRMRYEKVWVVKEVRRKRYLDTFNKLFLYIVGIFSTYVLQHHIAKDMVNVMFFFVAIISVREIEKIITDIEKVTGMKIWYYLKKHVLGLLKASEDNEKKDK